jgi:uncharacterized membrane protein YjfL (UPF0719 family)
MDIKAELFSDLTRTAAFVGLYFILFLFAKWLKDALTPYRINDELTQKDNLSVALTMAGYYLGTAAIFAGAMFGPSYGLYDDLLLVGGYSMLGLLFLNVARIFNDKLILPKFSVSEQLIEKHNVAVGALEFGIYVATGLIAAAALTGTGGGPATAVVFFVLGQVSLFLFTLIYNFTTPYCIHEELEQRNVGLGVALGGTLIALGIIIANGVQGDFVSWEANLIDLAWVNLMDRLIVPGDSVSREIIEDKNIGAGFLEATVAISFAVILKLVL